MKKKLFTLALAGVAALGLASCGGQQGASSSVPAPTSAVPSATSAEPGTTSAEPGTTSAAPGTSSTDPATSTPAPTSTAPTYPEDLFALNDYKAYVRSDLAFDFETVEAEKDNFRNGEYANARAAYEAGLAAINNGTSIADVKAAYKAAVAAILAELPEATGVFDYTKLSVEDRTALTAVVERYAVATGLTGLTLYEEGGYQLVNPRVTLGTENYILGYGFGTLAEGSIDADLEAESNVAWKRYYHSYESSDPGTANYWNDQGAQAGDLYGYFNSSLFTTVMNETRDNYKWIGELSKDDRPIAVNPDASGNADTWKVRIRTGADGLKYNTLSAKADRAAFNNRLVAAEDYLTPYKVQLTQANKLFRGGEYAGSTATKIKGLSEYYNATATVTGDALWDEAAWNKYVGDNLKVFQDGDDWYLQWTNTKPSNQFYAMYYIASSMYSPQPMEFIELVTLTNLFGYNETKSETPVDNSLSLGAYTLEAWNTDSEIVYKKNPNYVFADIRYSIPGVHLNILPGIKTDVDLAVKEFLAGKLDAAGITQNYLKEYKSDPRSHYYGTGSNFKINLNTADEATWEYYFGTNGVIKKNAEADYWDVEPALSNTHFVRGLSYALNRSLVAKAHASVASCSFLGGAYLADAENAVIYNNTQAHRDAISFITDDTDGYGYSLELAVEYFQMALAELEAEEKIVRGTPDNPTVITLQIAWMYPSQENTYHAEVKQCLESAFNYPAVSNGCYELNVEFWAGDVWSDVYYKKLMLGQFDLGFGSVSGNTYDILDYITILSADKTLSGGFTLNWGPKTDSSDTYFLVYNGYKWSFDNLLYAANGVTVLNNGKLAPAYDLGNDSEDGVYAEFKVNDDQTVEIEFNVSFLEGVTDTNVVVDDVVAFGYAGGVQDNANYKEESVLVTDPDTDEVSNVVITKNDDDSVSVKVTVSKALFDKYTTENFYPDCEGYLYVDLYLTISGKFNEVEYKFADAKYVDSLLYAPASDEPQA